MFSKFQTQYFKLENGKNQVQINREILAKMKMSVGAIFSDEKMHPQEAAFGLIVKSSMASVYLAT